MPQLPQHERNEDDSKRQLTGVTQLHTLKGGNKHRVRFVVWSPDGQWLASSSDDTTVLLWNPITGKLETLNGHKSLISSVTWSPDGQWLASSSIDWTIRLWNLATGKLQHLFEDHKSQISSVAWSPDGQWLASSAYDRTVRLWNPMTGKLQHTLEGHTDWVSSVVWSPDGKQLASRSYDRTVRLWNPMTGELQHTLAGHMSYVTSVVWSPDGKWLASNDNVVRLWNPITGELQQALKDYTEITSLAWSPDGKRLAFGSDDTTVRLWNPITGKLETLEVHTSGIRAVAWSFDGQMFLSSSRDSVENYIWRADTQERLVRLTGLQGAWHPHLPLMAMVEQMDNITVWHLDLERLFATSLSETAHYVNAKIVLVGDSGVGKSGLGLVLSGQPFVVTESTHGRRVWVFDSQEITLDERRRETREILLWDLAGQPGYRVIHQLHLNEVAVALVVFDAHNETDPFAGVRHWDRALRLAHRIQGSGILPLKKLLVAARIDRGGIGVSAERIQALVKELGFTGYFETSAKEGWQINELRDAIRQAIAWEALPRVSSTVLFQGIKGFLVEEKQRARRLISTVEDLYSGFLESKDTPVETLELPAQFETCIGRVESAGLIKRLSFGKLVLLQPELLDAYASALVNFVRDEPDGLGSIPEDQVRAGDFRMSRDERIKDVEQEKLLLIAMIEDLLRRELVLREEGMLIFPSQSTKEHPDLPDPPGKAVVFGFEGATLNIYATLAVRLTRSGLFKKKDLWKNAVTYTAIVGGTCGLYLRNIGEGRGELTLFFDDIASGETRRIFEEYVHLYLIRRALPDNFNVRHVLVCSGCGTVIPDEIIQRRKERNFDWITCPVCEGAISLIEGLLQSIAVPSLQTQKMDRSADSQREHEAAQSILQGKTATGDFDVFLCHHSIDKPAVKGIGEKLKERGILPWLDEWELPPGRPWQLLLEKQIGKIKAAAVFVGKQGIGPWQRNELDAFLREFVDRGCPVIPVLLSDAPKQPVLPLFLKGLTWVDFRKQEPDPMQQLFWGITGKRDVSERM